MPFEFEVELGPSGDFQVLQGPQHRFADVDFEAMAEQMRHDQQELINRLHPEFVQAEPEGFLQVEDPEDEDSAPEEPEDEDDEEEEDDDEPQAAREHERGQRGGHKGRHGDD